MKKILILTASAGHGHNSCAANIKENLDSSGQCQVKIIDIIEEFSNKLNAWAVSRGYSLAVEKFLPIYNHFYEMYNKRPLYKKYKAPVHKMAISTTPGLLKEIFEFKPDIIICTHFYAAIALSDIRLVTKLPCKIFMINLDYIISPFLECASGIDYFVIPSNEFIKNALDKGYFQEQLLPFGIPINENYFLPAKDKLQVRAELGLDPNILTILVLFGGGYWNGATKIIKPLLDIIEKPLQIIVINGKNKKSYKRIEKIRSKQNIKILNIGFTDKVDYYMSAADLMVSKAGGLSSTEAATRKLPLICTSRLPAQEIHNFNYLKTKAVLLVLKIKKN